MNMKRFRQVLAHIEAHPEEWDQVMCTMCFLAHAAKKERGKQITFGSWGADWLGLNWQQAHWIFSPHRTLDDFRTIARRPYA